MGRARTGWYRLRGGLLFHGTLPAGAVEIPAAEAAEIAANLTAPAPSPAPDRPAKDARKAELRAYVDRLNLDGDDRTSTRNLTVAQLWALIDGQGDEPVDLGDSGPQVDADVLVDEQPTDDLEVGDADAEGADTDEQIVDHGTEG